MVAYDVVNATDTALATGGSVAGAFDIAVSETLTDANLATLGGLDNVAVIKTASSQLELQAIAKVLLDHARDVRKGWRRV